LAVGVGREDGALLPGAAPVAPETQRIVDEEAQRIVESAEQDVIALLERERPRLDALAHALLERETLDQPQAYEIAGVEPPAFATEDGARAAAAP
jgi:cell division protease FtsH